MIATAGARAQHHAAVIPQTGSLGRAFDPCETDPENMNKAPTFLA
jgi:hypothetical protein